MRVASRGAPSQRRELLEGLVRSREPIGDLDVVVRSTEGDHHVAEVAADASIVELEGEVDLLEPRSAHTEEVGPVLQLVLRDVRPASSLMPREEVADEDAFRDAPPYALAATIVATARAISSAGISDSLKIAS